MNLHRGLAQRATLLLQRLDEIEPSVSAHAEVPENSAAKRLQEIGSKIDRLKEQNDGLSASLADISGKTANAVGSLPRELTWKTRRLLLRGGELLDDLKRIASDVPKDRGEANPLAAAYHQTVAMAEMALRSVQMFPDAAGDQLHLCEGLEAVLDETADRVHRLNAVIERNRLAGERVDDLARWHSGLLNQRPILWKTIQDLAEVIAGEAKRDVSLRPFEQDAERPEQWAAAHCLNVAAIIARLILNDAQWRLRPLDPIVAALVFDAGMAVVPAEVLGKTTPLVDDERRQIEAHVGRTAEAIKGLMPSEGWLLDAIRMHHERMDGTGYPAGEPGARIPRLARLLAVGDVYTALMARRPFRQGHSPRAALTETLLEAEKGRLDMELAEHLLRLSFYPVGTVVELADGQIGVVAAVHRPMVDLTAPARPIVQVLLNADGKPLPWPEHVNLARCEGQHIVRTLSKTESRSLLGSRCWPLL